MNERIQQAIEIAKAYRFENKGEIPVLVVAHGATEDFTLIGKFREDKRGNGKKTRDDQETFIACLRLAFAKHGVTSYEVITKPTLDNSALQITKNILAVFTVDTFGSVGEFFEIDEDDLIPCYSNIEITGWFSQLLPTSFKVDMPPKVESMVDKYIKSCTFTPMVESDEVIEMESVFDLVMNSL
jgi:hypothetical protein